MMKLGLGEPSPKMINDMIREIAVCLYYLVRVLPAVALIRVFYLVGGWDVH